MWEKVRVFFIGRVENILVIAAACFISIVFAVTYHYTHSYTYARDLSGSFIMLIVGLWKFIYSERRIRERVSEHNRMIHIWSIELVQANILLEKFDKASYTLDNMVRLLYKFKSTVSKINWPEIDMLIKDIEALDPKAQNIENRINFTKELISKTFKNLK